MSPCPDPYPNPSGWWLKLWTYRLVFNNFAVNIFEVTTFSTKHIFDEMSCIVLAFFYGCKDWFMSDSLACNPVTRSFVSRHCTNVHTFRIVQVYLSRIVRKPDFCLCKNKGADQLLRNCKADQRLCSRYADSTISLLPKSEMSSF